VALATRAADKSCQRYSADLDVISRCLSAIVKVIVKVL
jgi:hypothetical protein